MMCAVVWGNDLVSSSFPSFGPETERSLFIRRAARGRRKSINWRARPALLELRTENQYATGRWRPPFRHIFGMREKQVGAAGTPDSTGLANTELKEVRGFVRGMSNNTNELSKR